MKSEHKNEYVLCRPMEMSEMRDFDDPDGFKEMKWFRRDLAEISTAWRQIIPYVVVVNEKNMTVLSYTRTSSSGESRLREKRSIGFGGHVNPADMKKKDDCLNTVLRRCLRRELIEELDYPIQFESDIKYLPVEIEDDSDSVGRVHTGKLFLILVDDETMKSFKTEKSISNLHWISPERVGDDERYENWSRSVAKFLEGYLV